MGGSEREREFFCRGEDWREGKENREGGREGGRREVELEEIQEGQDGN